MSSGGVSVGLPGGLRLLAPNTAEARILHHEIFDAKVYDSHGICVRDEDCVFDVGANVGFYLVFLASRRKRLRLYAFEPVPDLFRLLERNVADHTGGSATRLFPFGLSSVERSVLFRYDPAFTLGTTCRADDVQRARRGATRLEWAQAVAQDWMQSGELGRAPSLCLLHALSTPSLGEATAAGMGLGALARGLYRKSRERWVPGEVRPLSAVIREHGVERIDLLKIDVEGSEWDVLAGIDDEHWPRIRQLILEVHDVDGRVERTGDLLSAKGYLVSTSPGLWALHDLLGIQNMFARRA
jgi:31-O-methyltransferase